MALEPSNFKNLETKRFKTCGYGDPYYDENGHYDEVACRYFNRKLEWCGEIGCPLDHNEKEE